MKKFMQGFVDTGQPRASQKATIAVNSGATNANRLGHIDTHDPSLAGQLNS